MKRMRYVHRPTETVVFFDGAEFQCLSRDVRSLGEEALFELYELHWLHPDGGAADSEHWHRETAADLPKEETV